MREMAFPKLSQHDDDDVEDACIKRRQQRSDCTEALTYK